MQKTKLLDLVLASLDDMKAHDTRTLDVHDLTSVTDTLVICSGTSTRQVKSIADRVVQRAKEAGFPPIGVEGENSAEWVLVDLGDVVVHVMLPAVRQFYQIEKLWDVPAELASSAVG